MKKILSTACAVLLLATALISCGKKEPEAQVLKVAGLKGAYGDAYWQDLKAGFEAANPGVTVELTIEAQVENTINPQIMAGAGPVCSSFQEALRSGCRPASAAHRADAPAPAPDCRCPRRSSHSSGLPEENFA